VSSVDAVTGENVSYTYDSLNRLIAAATSGTTGVQWGDSYSYDGFGNLTSKVVTKGTAPSVYPQVNSNTNQASMIGDNGFDANGNWLGPSANQVNTWNVENQLISTGTVDGSGNPYTYTYDPWGKRVLQYAGGAGGYPGGGTIYFYSITGQRLGSYRLYAGPSGSVTPINLNQFFGGRMLVAMDRLGSVRQNMAYYPWGEERTSTQDGTDKFATYFRDVNNNGVGEDYASARYYNNNFGRFWSPDPGYVGDANNPQSFNRYNYVLDDPVNHNDPSGLCTGIIAGVGQDPYTTDTAAQQTVANQIGAISAFPFAGGTQASGYLTVAVQGMGFMTEAVQNALNSILLAAQNPGPINIIAYSGGASAFTSAWNYLSPDIQQRIQSITYIDPGSAPWQPLQSGDAGTVVNVFEDSSDWKNTALELIGGSQPSSQNYYNTGNCGHDANCVFAKYAQQIEQGMSGCPIGAGSVFGAPLRISLYLSIPPPLAGVAVPLPSPPTVVVIEDSGTSVTSSIRYDQ
jgi:RHS repeat-associated protein